MACAKCGKETDLKRCEHCGGYYCNEHINPSLPSFPNFNNPKKFYKWKSKESHHPCAYYYDYVIKKHEEDIKKRLESLDSMKNFKIKKEPVYKEKFDISIDLDELFSKSKEKKISKKENFYDNKLEYIPCEKCGNKTSKKDLKKNFSSVLDKNIYLCPSCYSFGNITLNDIEKETEPDIIIKSKHEQKKSENKKYFGEKYYYKFKRWFLRKKHSRSRLRLEDFGIHLTILICSIFLFWMVLSNIEQLNNLKLLIIEIGSLVLLILLLIIFWAIYKLLKNFSYGFKGLANGYRAMISIIAILICLFLLLNPGFVVNSITSFDYDTLNPFEINIDFNGLNAIDDNSGVYNSDNNDVYENNNPKPEIDIAALELEIHNLINNERQNHGLPSLQLDSKLSDIARAHSQDMAINNYFSHDNWVGQGPTERAAAAGYPTTKDFGSYYVVGIGENIHKGWLYSQITYGWTTTYDWYIQSEIAYNAVNGWMNSPGHRENILSSTYDKEGIGIAISDDYAVYATQDFW